jgi:hypothetical protein
MNAISASRIKESVLNSMSVSIDFISRLAQLHYSAEAQPETLRVRTALGVEERHGVGRRPCAQARSAMLPLP